VGAGDLEQPDGCGVGSSGSGSGSGSGGGGKSGGGSTGGTASAGDPSSASSPSSSSAAAKKIVTDLAIVLENVAAGFVRPNIMDVKLGARLWDESAPPTKRARLDKVAAETTSSSLGFRIAGMRIWQGGGSQGEGEGGEGGRSSRASGDGAVTAAATTVPTATAIAGRGGPGGDGETGVAAEAAAAAATAPSAAVATIAAIATKTGNDGDGRSSEHLVERDADGGNVHPDAKSSPQRAEGEGSLGGGAAGRGGRAEHAPPPPPPPPSPPPAPSDQLGYRDYGKLYGRQFTADSVTDGFRAFLCVDGAGITPALGRTVARRLRRDVAHIRAALEAEESRMYGASILLVYEGDGRALEAALRQEAEEAEGEAGEQGPEAEGEAEEAKAAAAAAAAKEDEGEREEQHQHHHHRLQQQQQQEQQEQQQPPPPPPPPPQAASAQNWRTQAVKAEGDNGGNDVKGDEARGDHGDEGAGGGDGGESGDGEEDQEQEKEDQDEEEEEEEEEAEEGEEDEEEEDDDGKARAKIHAVKLIDFAHASWTPGQGPDENALCGVRNLERILRSLE
jgi:hypothetical protein